MKDRIEIAVLDVQVGQDGQVLVILVGHDVGVLQQDVVSGYEALSFR